MKALLVASAYAQGATVPENLNPNTNECDSIFSTGGYGHPGWGFTCIGQFVNNLAQVIIGAAGTLSLIMIIINGFRYMIGPAVPGGSSDAAKKGITFALYGLCLSLLTYIILETIIWAVTM